MVDEGDSCCSSAGNGLFNELDSEFDELKFIDSAMTLVNLTIKITARQL